MSYQYVLALALKCRVNMYHVTNAGGISPLQNKNKTQCVCVCVLAYTRSEGNLWKFPESNSGDEAGYQAL